MGKMVSRRSFDKSIVLALGAAAVSTLGAGQTRKLKIGYSTLAWDVGLKGPATFEDSVKDISNLGFWGFETVSPILEAYDANGLLPKLIGANHIPFKAGYIGVSVMDPSGAEGEYRKWSRTSRRSRSTCT
jgi:hypothetical protein